MYLITWVLGSTSECLWTHKYLRTCEFLTHSSESPGGWNPYGSRYSILNLEYPWVRIRVTHECTRALPYQVLNPLYLCMLANCNCTPITSVPIDPVTAAFMECSPTRPISTTPSALYGPHNFSALHSDMQNPWGSLSHPCHCPYLHTQCTKLRPLQSHHAVSPIQHSFN